VVIVVVHLDFDRAVRTVEVVHHCVRAGDEKLVLVLVAFLVGIAVMRGGGAAVLVAISIEAAVLLWRIAADPKPEQIR